MKRKEEENWEEGEDGLKEKSAWMDQCLISHSFTFLMCLYTCVYSSSISLSQPPNLIRIIEVEDDYYDEETPQTTPVPWNTRATTPHLIRRPCDYDPCVAQKEPCEQISAHTGCLCPGLTGPDARPEPPELRKITQEVRGTRVQWCAPRSFVKFYEVTLKDGEVKQIFGDYLRNGVLPEVNVGDQVCVAAGNDVGISDKTCAHFEAPEPNHALLNMSIIAGAVGILFVIGIVFAIVLWRRRTCRKAETGGADGLRNPSYSNDGGL
ncbi:hypothetical protein DNTS_021123 [Danionella cerebrum]|uniref:Uncharacterized protein n=1 Tax=Danionella cerebrum TaxID=2873325 RepID=A0A553QVG8_9TELE|nr:hypothetical protein DNTS_021123 [Danionella translucida]